MASDEIGILQYEPPCGERLIGRERHRPTMQVALVDDLEHEVRGVTADGEVYGREWAR
jgi:hypothetical protein